MTNNEETDRRINQVIIDRLKGINSLVDHT